MAMRRAGGPRLASSRVRLSAGGCHVLQNSRSYMPFHGSRFMPVLPSQESFLDRLQTTLDGFEPNPLSHQRFDQSHEWFESQSNQQDQILAWLRRVGSSRIDCQHQEETFRVLSIGCGSGILDRPLIEKWTKSAKANDATREIDYIGIDPNPIACQRFRDEFEKMGLDSVDLSVMEETVESYRSSGSFDLTHVVHSLYYFDDPAESIRALMDRVADDGELVIFQAPKAELNLLADCFWQEHTNDPIWFSGELDDHLRSAGISFQRNRIDAEVNMTACFDEDSSEGKLTLDFLVQSDCETLPTEVRASVLDYLRAISRDERQQVFAPHPVDVFTLSSN